LAPRLRVEDWKYRNGFLDDRLSMGCGRLGFGARRVGERDELHVGFGGDIKAKALRHWLNYRDFPHDVPSWYEAHFTPFSEN
jgi:hypothetical protein